VSAHKAAGLTGRESGAAINAAKSTANNLAAIEKLCPELRRMFDRGELPMGKALRLVKFPHSRQLEEWNSGSISAAQGLNRTQVKLLRESVGASLKADEWRAGALAAIDTILHDSAVDGVWPAPDAVRNASKWDGRARRRRR
jgi:hypothetical protein